MGVITCFLFHFVVSVSDGGFFPGRCWGVRRCRRLWRRRSRRRLLGHTGGMICAVHPGSLQLQVVKQGHPCLTPPQHCNHSSWRKGETHITFKLNTVIINRDLLASKSIFTQEKQNCNEGCAMVYAVNLSFFENFVYFIFLFPK